MTGQCRKCQQLITGRDVVTPDPTGTLRVSALADAVHEHMTLHHLPERRGIAGILRILEAPILVGFVDCVDPEYKGAVKALTDVVRMAMDEQDKRLDEDTLVELRPVPEKPRPLIVTG